MSKNFTLKKAKTVEQKVCDTLNKSDRGMEYTLCQDKYSHFDIYGVGEHKHFEIIEVKQRRDNPNWKTWFIEQAKINHMYDEKLKAMNKGNTMDLFLVIVSDGKTVMYDINDIIQYPVITVEMNATTAKGFRNQGKKIPKEVYDFPKSLKHITL